MVKMAKKKIARTGSPLLYADSAFKYFMGVVSGCAFYRTQFCIGASVFCPLSGIEKRQVGCVLKL